MIQSLTSPLRVRSANYVLSAVILLLLSRTPQLAQKSAVPLPVLSMHNHRGARACSQIVIPTQRDDSQRLRKTPKKTTFQRAFDVHTIIYINRNPLKVSLLCFTAAPLSYNHVPCCRSVCVCIDRQNVIKIPNEVLTKPSVLASLFLACYILHNTAGFLNSTSGCCYTLPSGVSM